MTLGISTLFTTPLRSSLNASDYEKKELGTLEPNEAILDKFKFRNIMDELKKTCSGSSYVNTEIHMINAKQAAKCSEGCDFSSVP